MSVFLLARHDRSFRLPGRLPPGATLHDAAALYAFRRTVDDLADETSAPGDARTALRARPCGDYCRRRPPSRGGQLGAAGLGPDDIADAAEPVFDAVQRVLARAEQSDRSAELGHRCLPARMRPAIRAASRLYQEIGLRVLSRGPGYLREGRCVARVASQPTSIGDQSAGCWCTEVAW